MCIRDRFIQMIRRPSCSYTLCGSWAKRSYAQLITRGDTIKFKKCKFQASLVRIDSPDDVEDAIALVTDCRKISKATHPCMYAWQTNNSAGFGDDGERGAGRRILQTLEQAHRSNVLVGVTRWYGGSHLGSARFRVISQAARSVL